MFIGGGVGGVGRIGGGGRRGNTPAGAADFTLSGNSATTVWNAATVFGDLVPNGGTPAGAYFVLVGEPAGLAVVNG